MPRRLCPPAAMLTDTYRAPALRKGDREHCLFRDALCKVTSYTDAPISWPKGVPVGRRSAPSLIVTEELVRAIRNESAKAVRWHWGVGRGVVWRYRQAFGVTRTNNPRTHQLIRESSARGADALRGVPLSEEAKDQRRRKAIELNLAAHLKNGNHVPRWTDEQLALLGALPEEEVARRTGRTVNAVRLKRSRLGVPAGRDGSADDGRRRSD